MENDYIKLGDCKSLIDELPNKSIDLVVTDPPYRFESAGGGSMLKTKVLKEYTYNH